MTNIAHPDLLAEIADFCGNKMSKAAFGKAAMRDPRFVYDIEAGRQCLPSTVRRVREYIANHQPSPSTTGVCDA